MKYLSRILPVIALTFIILSCGTTDLDSPNNSDGGGAISDGGNPEDGGQIIQDGGTQEDGGPALDGGDVEDGGLSEDGGPPEDGGVPSGPIAVCPNNISTSIGETVHFDGSGSGHSEGEPIRYEWYIVEKPDRSTSTVHPRSAIGLKRSCPLRSGRVFLPGCPCRSGAGR